MRLLKLLLGLGLVIYCCWAIIVRIPAGWGAHFLLNATPNLSMMGVNGTVWRGEAGNAKITIDGKTIDLGHLTWQLQPAALFKMKACALIRSDLLAGDVCRTAGGINQLTNLLIDRLPAKILNDAMGVQLAGLGNITVQTFYVNDIGDISKLEGTVLWENAGINVGTGWYQLGDFAIALSENGSGGLYANITDTKETGPFGVEARGDIKLREMPKFKGTISPRNNAPNDVVQALSIFGQPNGNNGYEVTWPPG